MRYMSFAHVQTVDSGMMECGKFFSRMPTARAEATAVGYKLKLIVVGGYTGRPHNIH